MPLPIIGSVITNYRVPLDFLAYVGLTFFIIAVIRAYAQGRSTSRDRDLHGRVILLTARCSLRLPKLWLIDVHL